LTGFLLSFSNESPAGGRFLMSGVGSEIDKGGCIKHLKGCCPTGWSGLQQLTMVETHLLGVKKSSPKAACAIRPSTTVKLPPRNLIFDSAAGDSFEKLKRKPVKSFFCRQVF
jgi:hypothetical protein